MKFKSRLCVCMCECVCAWMDAQLCQHHLLKMLSLTHWNAFLQLCQKLIEYICVALSLGSLFWSVSVSIRPSAPWYPDCNYIANLNTGKNDYLTLRRMIGSSFSNFLAILVLLIFQISCRVRFPKFLFVRHIICKYRQFYFFFSNFLFIFLAFFLTLLQWLEIYYYIK